LQFQIILTYECNLKCVYCGGTIDTEPKDIQYQISELLDLISQDPEPVIGFYGGEPLLRAGLLKEIMDLQDATYVLQTNGLLLGELPSEYLRRFHAILVSIDGRKSVTDGYRGKGIYPRVLDNARSIRQRGFTSDLVARMTVSTMTDIHEDVTHLAWMEDPKFDHVQWQLDFELFWERGKPVAEVNSWLEESYNPGISQLVEEWVINMERDGKVLGLVPFQGFMSTLLSGRKTTLRCGSGIDSFAVLPTGHIGPCPVFSGSQLPDLGSMIDVTPQDLQNTVKLKEPCTSCDIFGVCGGRCLLVNLSQDNLKERGYEMICKSVRHLVNQLESVKPRVQKLLDDGAISPSDLRYPDILNGCEVTP